MNSFFGFLKTLAQNNNRPWFEQNKKLYEEAKLQAESLVDSCIAEVGKVEDLGDLKAK